MYDWRKMTSQEREEVLKERKLKKLPLHSPPHEDWGEGSYHLTAACYEHKPIIGTSIERMTQCETHLLETVREHTENIFAWCVLPNHYHLLIKTEKILYVIDALGKFHGRLSYQWNKEEAMRGRSVWRNCMECAIRSDRHFWATMNYVHHNPVHHKYVPQWQGWPFSSATDFLDSVGKEEATRIWKEYPVLDYGKGWDAPSM